MATQSPTTLARTERARTLAARYPHAKEALDFYAHLIGFPGMREDLLRIIARYGPQLLRESARAEREPAVSFIERVLERQQPPVREAPHSNRCPSCGQKPQCAVLRPEGHGAAYHLMCNLCLTEWRYPRAQCPCCGAEGELAFYQLDLFPHIQIQTCDACQRYLHVVDTSKDPEACPDVDEIAALPLDVWAIDQGYEKITPNLIGI
ncbi:MAG: formate dehydrogenase accessory protein FdhE [Acidobacteria bacterium]|nr:formate dehydrogenase accessory protein FdhE [Acidobacteriota bacterium]